MNLHIIWDAAGAMEFYLLLPTLSVVTDLNHRFYKDWCKLYLHCCQKAVARSLVSVGRKHMFSMLMEHLHLHKAYHKTVTVSFNELTVNNKYYSSRWACVHVSNRSPYPDSSCWALLNNTERKDFLHYESWRVDEALMEGFLIVFTHAYIIYYIIIVSHCYSAPLNHFSQHAQSMWALELIVTALSLKMLLYIKLKWVTLRWSYFTLWTEKMKRWSIVQKRFETMWSLYTVYYNITLTVTSQT